MVTELKEAIDNLPLGLYAVMDAVDDLSERTLILFTGTDQLDLNKDAFNFFLSQVCIRVEMTFGRLINKWRMLNGTVHGSVARTANVLMACA